MSKVKHSRVDLYELLYIISNDFTEEEAQKIHEKVKENLKKKDCEISYKEQWGKKRLAYPINHFKHGYYNLLEFTVDKSKLDEINYFLRLSDEVLRHQVVIRKYSNDDPRSKHKIFDQTPEEIKEEEKEEVKEEVKEEAKTTTTEVSEKEVTSQEVDSSPEQGGKEEVEKPTQDSIKEEESIAQENKEKEEKKKEKEENSGKEEEKKEKEDEEKKKKKDSDKVDLKDLDEKLDDILNTDDLV